MMKRWFLVCVVLAVCVFLVSSVQASPCLNGQCALGKVVHKVLPPYNVAKAEVPAVVVVVKPAQPAPSACAPVKVYRGKLWQRLRCRKCCR